MSDAPGDRPQDVGRRHRRRRPPSTDTEAVLERYRSAMRAELDGLLEEIRPALGQLTIAGDVTAPPLERRRALWDLAIKLGKELGNGAELDELEEPPGPAPVVTGGAPRLTKARRRQLGG